MTKYFTLVFLSLIFSCSRKNPSESFDKSNEQLTSLPLEKRATIEFSPSQYVLWVNNPENGLRRLKRVNDINYNLICKPHDYIVCNELKTNQINGAVYQNVLTELGEMMYFDLKISIENFHDEFLKYNLNDGNKYENRVEYCSFKMQRDIYLVSGTDTLPCELFHFERTYGISPYGNFLLGFSHIADDQNFTLVFHDQLFQNGWIKFPFPKNLFTHLPKLETI